MGRRLLGVRRRDGGGCRMVCGHRLMLLRRRGRGPYGLCVLIRGLGCVWFGRVSVVI